MFHRYLKRVKKQKPTTTDKSPCYRSRVKLWKRLSERWWQLILQNTIWLLNNSTGSLPTSSAWPGHFLETIDVITEARNFGFPATIVFMDLAKAFDRVCHRGLIKKLEAYGFHGNLLARLKNFLSHRKQRVVIGERKSEWKEVLSGVPQDSELGPLFFLIYINDMPGVVSSITNQFADDTKILKIIRNRLEVVNLQKDMDKHGNKRQKLFEHGLWPNHEKSTDDEDTCRKRSRYLQNQLPKIDNPSRVRSQQSKHSIRKTQAGI